eukprot:CAMPEP_0178518304 /NCGR_PEP_ID=MMETSP0696-20121128/26186_1 /TAXON_ID=265572 /ORGANISM="Extubocellulus spinifer, Strain CCMP396" /LENGTH=380 /DNA_ID=CAMNT_0020148859 /DNA_START=159 /DNA_END=1301 /DNA_ORIENTATION=+
MASSQSNDGSSHGGHQAPTPGKDRETNNAGILNQILAFGGVRFLVLMVLCLQNSMFTVLRRYSLGVLKEEYSKHECLLLAEAIKMVFSAMMISKSLTHGESTTKRLSHVVRKSSKMLFLAFMYGSMNILSFVALRNIGAGLFTIFAQLKILTTATFSAIVLRRTYSSARWRALISLMLGVLLFSEPIWNNADKGANSVAGGNTLVGCGAVLIEVSLSGFASIYFEKVIKTDTEKMTIWERNFQLAMWSFPIYLCFILFEGGGHAGFLGGWSIVALMLSILGAAGGLLVALSIKYGDSILKTLAVTGSILLSSLIDHYVLFGPLTPIMVIAGAQVVVAICNYTFDLTPVETKPKAAAVEADGNMKEMDPLIKQEEGGKANN